MDVTEMRALVERHLKAEGAGDIEGAVAVYTDDVVHDAVGFPGTPRQGKDAAREFYGFLTATSEPRANSRCTSSSPTTPSCSSS